MNDLCLLLSDSELASAQREARTLRLRFAVMPVGWARHTNAQPEGYITGVTLVLDDADIQRSEGAPIGRISEGRVTCDGVTVPRLSLQGHWAGRVIVTLQGGQRFQLEAAGAALTIMTDGPVQVRESYAC